MKKLYTIDGCEMTVKEIAAMLGVNKLGQKCHWARYRMGAR